MRWLDAPLTDEWVPERVAVDNYYDRGPREYALTIYGVMVRKIPAEEHQWICG